MILFEAIQLCPEWRPEMQDWTVTSIYGYHQGTKVQNGRGQIVGAMGEHQRVRLKFVGPWKAAETNRVELDFPFADRVPMPKDGSHSRTVLELDRENCPEGALLVWNEKETPPEYNTA